MNGGTCNMISEQCPSWRRYLDIYNEYAQNGKTIDELKNNLILLKEMSILPSIKSII